MTKLRIYNFDDPDFPKEHEHIKGPLLAPQFGESVPEPTGYQKFKQARDEFRQKVRQRRETREQLGLSIENKEVKPKKKVIWG